MEATSSLFLGDQSGCKGFCRGRSGYYVYVLRRPDGRPFYVGKGTLDRVFQHENEARHPNGRLNNAHKLNVIRSIWRSGGSVGYEIDFWSDDPGAAYERETALIVSLGRLHEGGPLTNRSPGGGSVAGASPFSKERHSSTLSGEPEDNPERATLNRFVLAIAPMRSVVLKPINQFTPKPTLKYPTKKMSLSLRQAAAVVASAASNGVRLERGSIVPRRVNVDGVEGIVEDGVSCDLLTSGSVTLISASAPADEQFQLTEIQARAIVGWIGIKKCTDLGVI